VSDEILSFTLYDTNDWSTSIQRLVTNGARFGVNWLITPDELPQMEAKFLNLLSIGVRDFLLLSYKGNDPALHLSYQQYDEFTHFVNQMHKALNEIAQIKLDVCWGHAVQNVPVLFERSDCGAGSDFISITSDQQIKPCSFHHLSIPFKTLADVRAYWEKQYRRQQAAAIAGCARLQDRAVNSDGEPKNEIIHLAAI
jgi:hypothetical protein